MRASSVIMIYFVLGATMFGGGAIAWSDAGVATWVVDYNESSGALSPSNNTTSNAQGLGGAIQSVVNLAVGAILLVWNLFKALITFMHWPIVVLWQNNAPPLATITLGGALVLAFYMSLLRLVRTSA